MALIVFGFYRCTFMAVTRLYSSIDYFVRKNKNHENISDNNDRSCINLSKVLRICLYFILIRFLFFYILERMIDINF